MAYTKKQFGTDLKDKLIQESDYQEISKWAFKIYNNHGLEFEDGLDYFVLKLISMEEGPEFMLSSEGMHFLSEELIGKIR